jgi:adenylate cyclase
MERKLAAIFSTDVAGYSRLMGQDEEATIRTLTAYRAVMTALIQRHRGRVVDSPGDNLLAEFASVVDAVRCAVEIQHALTEKNAELPPPRKMEFRIGLNLGDVVVEGERLYGDGVNIAARLEGLAASGGICISGKVFEEVEGKLPLTYEYLGEQTVKNIAKPVRVWRVVLDAAAAARRQVPSPLVGEGQGEGALGMSTAVTTPHPDLPPQGGKEPKRSARGLKIWVVAAGLLLLAATIGTLRYLSRPSLSPQSSSLITQEAPALPLPDKPSLIVLPFVNMSKDPDQEYFSDGLTEVLTGDLSKLSSLFVIARNSAFTYKGKVVKVQDVGREMGVRYVLEGSVQKADQQVRITAQLIEATTGYHLWSEQYDRPLKDIFALHDEIVQKIVTTLKLQLTLQEQGYLVRKHTDNLEAYDAFLRGREYESRFTKEADAQARQMFEKAVALDPQYAEAYTWLGWIYWVEWVERRSVDPQTLERALALAQRALTLDDSLPIAHSHLGMVYAQKQQYEQAIAEGERAIALDPNNADSYAFQGEVLRFAGRPEDALRMLAQAMRLNPHYPPLYSFFLGMAYHQTGRYAESVATLKEHISRRPNSLAAHLILALSYVAQWASQQSADAQTLAQALAARRAMALTAAIPWGHTVWGSVYLWQQQYEPALAEMERAIALDPDDAFSSALLAETLSRVGRAEEAVARAEQALRRKPIVADGHLDSVGAAYYLAGRPEEAIALLKQYLSRYPNILGAHLTLAAVYSELGREAEARAEAAEVLRLNPKFSLEIHKERMPIKDPAALERHLAALRKAGLK